MLYGIYKHVTIKLKDGSNVVTTSRVIDTKRHSITNMSVIDVFNFCNSNDIPLSETMFDSMRGSVDLVQFIYEEEDKIRERLEQKKKEDYELYLSLKKRFNDV